MVEKNPDNITNYFIFYDDIFDEGGAPDEFRELSKKMQATGLGNVHIVITGENDDIKSSGVMVISECQLKQFVQPAAFNVAFYVCYSSLASWRYSMKFSSLFNRNVLFPINQINRFLDSDNPFSGQVVPSIKNLEGEGGKSLKMDSYRVREGRKGFYTQIMKAKRLLFRRLFGGPLLKRMSYIAVFSEYEKKNIKYYHPGMERKCVIHRMGTYVPNSPKIVQHFEPGTINVTMWTRVDFFYKGIDRFIEYIGDSLDKLPSNMIFNIIGPDYRNGYSRVGGLIKAKNLETRVRLYKIGEYVPGDKSLFLNSDCIVSLSRWDGLPRTLREAVVCGIPVVCSSESNFDYYIDRYGNGATVVNAYEFECAMKRVADGTFKNNAAEISLRHLFEWEHSVRDLLARVTL